MAVKRRVAFAGMICGVGAILAFGSPRSVELTDRATSKVIGYGVGCEATRWINVTYCDTGGPLVPCRNFNPAMPCGDADTCFDRCTPGFAGADYTDQGTPQMGMVVFVTTCKAAGSTYNRRACSFWCICNGDTILTPGITCPGDIYAWTACDA